MPLETLTCGFPYPSPPPPLSTPSPPLIATVPLFPLIPGVSLSIAAAVTAPFRRAACLVVEANGKKSIGCTKEGTQRKRARKSGFKARLATANGRKILAARRARGRKHLAPASVGGTKHK